MPLCVIVYTLPAPVMSNVTVCPKLSPLPDIAKSTMLPGELVVNDASFALVIVDPLPVEALLSISIVMLASVPSQSMSAML